MNNGIRIIHMKPTINYKKKVSHELKFLYGKSKRCFS